MPYNKTEGSPTGWKKMILESNRNPKHWKVQEMLNVGKYKRVHKCKFIFSNFFKIGKIVKSVIKICIVGFITYIDVIYMIK